MPSTYPAVLVLLAVDGTMGQAIGVARGKAEGEAKAGRNMVLAALRKKFKKVPKGIETEILAMSDPIALESLLVHAIDSSTLDEFAAVLK